MKKKLCFGLIALLGFVNVALAQETAKAVVVEQIKVVKISVGTEVEDRKLLGEASEFESFNQVLWCWTKITTDMAPNTVKHVWYLNGKTVAEVKLHIKYTYFTPSFLLVNC